MDISQTRKIASQALATSTNFDIDLRDMGRTPNRLSYHIKTSGGSGLSSATRSILAANDAAAFDNNVVLTGALPSAISDSDVIVVSTVATRYLRLNIDPAGGAVTVEIDIEIVDD